MIQGFTCVDINVCSCFEGKLVGCTLSSGVFSSHVSGLHHEGGILFLALCLTRRHNLVHKSVIALGTSGVPCVLMHVGDIGCVWLPSATLGVRPAARSACLASPFAIFVVLPAIKLLPGCDLFGRLTSGRLLPCCDLCRLTSGRLLLLVVMIFAFAKKFVDSVPNGRPVVILTSCLIERPVLLQYCG